MNHRSIFARSFAAFCALAIWSQSQAATPDLPATVQWVKTYLEAGDMQKEVTYDSATKTISYDGRYTPSERNDVHVSVCSIKPTLVTFNLLHNAFYMQYSGASYRLNDEAKTRQNWSIYFGYNGIDEHDTRVTEQQLKQRIGDDHIVFKLKKAVSHLVELECGAQGSPFD